MADMERRQKRQAVLGVPFRLIGPLAIGALTVAFGALWLLMRPQGEPVVRHLGQLSGGESILLMSLALVLISTLPQVEQIFGGIDYAAIWHRRLAITGTLLLLPHVELASNPQATDLGKAMAVPGAVGLAALVAWAMLPRWRTFLPAAMHGPVLHLRDSWPVKMVTRVLGGYERWRGFHRLTGLFVAAGFFHGLLDATIFDSEPVLRWTYVVVGGVGLGFYAYRELVARYFLPHHDYQVDEVRTVAPGLVDVHLKPLGEQLDFRAGQFAMIYLETKEGWLRHPFSISGSPADQGIRITVKALGDHTAKLPDLVEPGMPAVVSGPYGGFDRLAGTPRQVWIAAGVGITPFLSWLRSLDGELQETVHLFVTSAGRSPFTDEIETIAAQQPGLTVHLIDTQAGSRLTPQQVLDTAGGDPAGVSVFMGGPDRMLRQFRRAFQAAGVRAANIHREYFHWR
jgi:predicted ferric reductase